MAYINGLDRNQGQLNNASLDDFIAQDNPVRVIDAYVDSLDLKKLGFIVYDGNNKGQAPYRCS
ncbi:MAG: IS1182 family transposase, partial [Clostridiales bacterium]|nr:IS1182 family transposase [Clostridiales bacterium]